MYLNVECNWHEFERALLVQVAELLHHKKQIVLLCQQLVLFKVINHLMGHFVLTQWLLACGLAQRVWVPSKIAELISDAQVTQLLFFSVA